MNDEEKRYIEHFKKLNDSPQEATPPNETNKLLRVIALLIAGAIAIYLATARIW